MKAQTYLLNKDEINENYLKIVELALKNITSA